MDFSTLSKIMDSADSTELFSKLSKALPEDADFEEFVHHGYFHFTAWCADGKWSEEQAQAVKEAIDAVGDFETAVVESIDGTGFQVTGFSKESL